MAPFRLLCDTDEAPQQSEPFEFDVAFSTTFEQIERLRELMLAFLKAERRDYQPIFDVYVIGAPKFTVIFI